MRVDSIWDLMRLRGRQDERSDTERRYLISLGHKSSEYLQVLRGEMTREEYNDRAYERGKSIQANDQRLKEK